MSGDSPPDLIVEPTEGTSQAIGSASTSDGQPLSKKAQKRLAKAAYMEERKKERRAAEKERRKEKKRIEVEKRAAGELDEEEDITRDRKRRKTGQGPKTYFQARVVIDLGFDDKMTENEVKSLTSQLAYTYSANRKSEHPFSSLLFTSLDGKTLARMDGINKAAYKRWVGAEWWQEGYERLWADCNHEQSGHGEDGGGKHTADPVDVNVVAEIQQIKRGPSRAERESIVYLTADSDEELTELKEGETYIIGGIVDHNRYKNLCLNKSREHKIRSARLPIGTYLTEMRTRQVLTVNQTFEILLKWAETRDWEQALYAVMPKRKFNEEGRRRGGGSDSSKGEGADEDKVGEGEGVDVEDPQVIDAAALEATEE